MCQLLDEVKVPSKIILDSAVGYGFIYTVQPLNKNGHVGPGILSFI